MKTLLGVLVGVCLLISSAVELPGQDAQDDGDNAQRRQLNRRQDQERRQRSLIGQLRAAINQMELDEESQAAITVLLEEFAPKIQEAQQKIRSLLTDEQRQAQLEANRRAREDGLQGRELREAVDAALGLTEEQIEKRGILQREMRELQAKLIESLSAHLTEEQQRSLRRRDRGDRRTRDSGDGDGDGGGDDRRRRDDGG